MNSNKMLAIWGVAFATFLIALGIRNATVAKLKTDFAIKCAEIGGVFINNVKDVKQSPTNTNTVSMRTGEEYWSCVRTPKATTVEVR